MRITTILALLLATVLRLNAQPPPPSCPTDTLFLGGSPTFAQQTDSLQSPMLPCYAYDCKAQHCHAWQLPPNFVGHLELTSPNPLLLPLSVQLWDDCHYVRWEDCVTVGASSTVDWDTNLVFPANAQVVVCNAVDAVTITIKPGPATDTLPVAFLYVDTLCGGLLGIDPPQPNEDYIYWTVEDYAACLLGRLAYPRDYEKWELQPNARYLKKRRYRQ